MAVRIRLTRVGRRNKPLYRVAVFDARTRRDGRYIEKLGTYDPTIAEEKNKVNIKKDRLKYWQGKGAQLTPALKAIFKKTGTTK